MSFEMKKRYIYSLKPAKCPCCGGLRIAVILYGMPNFTGSLDSDIAEGKVVLGGCCVSDDDPAWQCADCNEVFYRRG